MLASLLQLLRITTLRAHCSLPTSICSLAPSRHTDGTPLAFCLPAAYARVQRKITVARPGAFFLAVLEKLRPRTFEFPAEKSGTSSKSQSQEQRKRKRKSLESWRKIGGGGGGEARGNDAGGFMELGKVDGGTQIVEEIRGFYGLDQRFPVEQLVVRSQNASQIRYVSASAHRFMSAAPQVEVVSAGVRVMQLHNRSAGTSRFRLRMDGLELMLPYLGSERALELQTPSFCDLLRNRKLELPADADLSEGPVVVRHRQVPREGWAGGGGGGGDSSGDGADEVLGGVETAVTAFVGKNLLHLFVSEARAAAILANLDVCS